MQPVVYFMDNIQKSFFRYDFDDLAFNIASQLNEHDLFMDLYHYAQSVENPVLLATAQSRAQQITAQESARNFSSGKYLSRVHTGRMCSTKH